MGLFRMWKRRAWLTHPDDLDFLSLPFDLGAAEGVNAVTQTEIPLPQGWQANWFG